MTPSPSPPAMPAMPAELLPCPCCGGPAESDSRQSYRALGDGRIGDAYAIYCLSCGLQISVCYCDVPEQSMEEVSEYVRGIWNRRPALSRQEQPQVTLPQGVKRIDDRRLSEIVSGYADFPVPDYFETSSLAYEVRNWRMGSPAPVEPPQDEREQPQAGLRHYEGGREPNEQETAEALRFIKQHGADVSTGAWLDRAITLLFALSTLSRQSGRGGEAAEEFTKGAVSVVKPKGTEETGDDRPAASICVHKGFYVCKICGKDLTPDIPYADGPGRGL